MEEDGYENHHYSPRVTLVIWVVLFVVSWSLVILIVYLAYIFAMFMWGIIMFLYEMIFNVKTAQQKHGL